MSENKTQPMSISTKITLFIIFGLVLLSVHIYLIYFNLVPVADRMLQDECKMLISSGESMCASVLSQDKELFSYVVDKVFIWMLIWPVLFFAMSIGVLAHIKREKAKKPDSP